MVHVTDMKRTTLMEQVADDYEQLGKQGRFSKKCILRGYIPDLNWTTIHKDLDQPIKPVKQEEDPTKTTTSPAAPSEVERAPSSHLRSKTKQQTTSIQSINSGSTRTQFSSNRGQQSANCTKRLFFDAMDTYPIMGQESLKHNASVAARCTLMVAMAIYKLKCNQT